MSMLREFVWFIGIVILAGSAGMAWDTLDKRLTELERRLDILELAKQRMGCADSE